MWTRRERLFHLGVKRWIFDQRINEHAKMSPRQTLPHGLAQIGMKLHNPVNNLLRYLIHDGVDVSTAAGGGHAIDKGDRFKRT